MRRLATAALAAAALTTLGAAPAPAATVELFWTALVSRGAAVDVAYGVTCPAGSTGTVEVSLTQLRDDGLTASGTGTAVLTCGFPDTERVTASIAGAPFTRGPATLTMLVSGCDGPDCFTVPVNRTVRLRN